jgi:hypothetical protein
MSVNKHLVMKTWVEQFLGDKMHFEDIQANQGARSFVPQYGDYVQKTDICGNKYKFYTFGFIAIEPLDMNDQDSNNATTMNTMDLFNDWLELQQKNKNFPDFGTNVTNYRIVPLQNMANVAQYFEDIGMVKYILVARIEYVEKEL